MLLRVANFVESGTCAPRLSHRNGFQLGALDAAAGCCTQVLMLLVSQNLMGRQTVLEEPKRRCPVERSASDSTYAAENSHIVVVQKPALIEQR